MRRPSHLQSVRLGFNRQRSDIGGYIKSVYEALFRDRMKTSFASAMITEPYMMTGTVVNLGSRCRVQATYNRDHVLVSHPIATLRSSILVIGRSSVDTFGRGWSSSTKAGGLGRSAAADAAVRDVVQRRTGNFLEYYDIREICTRYPSSKNILPKGTEPRSDFRGAVAALPG